MLVSEPRPQTAPAAEPARAVILDPVTGVAIPGAITAELSESHVRFRADDGLVWATPKSLLKVDGVTA